MFQFISNQIPDTIVVVGCGGTGSRLVPMLAQFVRSITRGPSPMGWLQDPRIILVDDDTVEQKNLMRQNFISPDVGFNKARVLASRYSQAFDVQIDACAMRLGGGGIGIQDLINGDWSRRKSGVASIANVMFILCVDSAASRKEIVKAILKINFVMNSATQSDEGLASIVIDAGNENDYGQVGYFNAFYYNGKVDTKSPEYLELKNMPMRPTLVPTSSIPIDLEYYRALVDAPSQGSCADLDQTLAINALMATNIMGIVQNIYYRKPMTYTEVSTSLTGSNRTTYYTAENFVNRTQIDFDRSELLPSNNSWNGFRLPTTAIYKFKDYVDKQRVELK